MVTLNITEKTARNLLDYINEFIDHTSSRKFISEAIGDKMKIKKAIGRSEGIPVKFLNDFRLKDIVS
jgi:hypothetical protein